MTIAELFSTLAKRAGVQSTALDAILSNPELTKINIEETDANQFAENLMNVEQAKSNPDVKKFWQGTTHTTIKGKVSTLIDQFIEDEAIRNELKANDNTFELIPSLVTKIAELKEAKYSAKGKDKEEVMKQLSELENVLKQERAAKATELDGLRSEFKSKLSDMSLNAHLKSYKYGTGHSDDVNIIVARELIQKNLRDKGAAMVYDEGSGSIKLVNANDPSLPYKEQQNEVDLKSFSDRVFADAKLLEIPKAPTPTTPPPRTPMPPQGGNTMGVDTSREKAYLEKMGG